MLSTHIVPQSAAVSLYSVRPALQHVGRISDAEFMRQARALEHRFARIKACTACGCPFYRELVFQRLYELAGGLCLAVLWASSGRVPKR